MAVVKHLCGECGAKVQQSMARCPQCTQPLDWGAATPEAMNKCDACGFRNPPVAATCESCGAQLRGARSRSGIPPATERKKKKGAVEPATPKAAAGKRVEPWQIASLVAVVALIALLVGMEIARDDPTIARQSSATLSVPPAAIQMPGPTDIAPFEQALAANPTDPAPLLKLANVLHDNGSYERAIETYKKYLAKKPADPDARVDMGICYYELGMRDTVDAVEKFTLAAREMEEASRRSPSHQAAAFNLGVVNLHLQKIEESTKWFKKAVALGATSDLGQRAQQMLSQHTFSP